MQHDRLRVTENNVLRKILRPRGEDEAGDWRKLDNASLQWNLNLSFFKGREKTNDECGQTINPENYYTM